MSKKNINVCVSAPSASGKTTILWTLIKTLIEHGIEVKYSFENSEYKNIEHLQNSIEHDFPSLSHRLNSMKDKIVVNIEEKNID